MAFNPSGDMMSPLLRVHLSTENWPVSENCQGNENMQHISVPILQNKSITSGKLYNVL